MEGFDEDAIGTALLWQRFEVFRTKFGLGDTAFEWIQCLPTKDLQVKAMTRFRPKSSTTHMLSSFQSFLVMICEQCPSVLANGHCENGEDCLRSHAAEPINVEFPKVVCKAWQKGQCAKGERCWRSHEFDEKKLSEEVIDEDRMEVQTERSFDALSKQLTDALSKQLIDAERKKSDEQVRPVQVSCEVTCGESGRALANVSAFQKTADSSSFQHKVTLSKGPLSKQRYYRTKIRRLHEQHDAACRALDKSVGRNQSLRDEVARLRSQQMRHEESMLQMENQVAGALSLMQRKEQEQSRQIQAERERADSLEIKVRNLESELVHLKSMLSSGLRPAVHGVQWQYHTDQDWCSFGLEENEVVHAAYISYLQGGDSSLECSSGGLKRKIDFVYMSQTNLDTRRRRNVRMKLSVPNTWTKQPCVLLQQQEHPNAMYMVESSSAVWIAIKQMLARCAHQPMTAWTGSNCHAISRATVTSIYRVENFGLWQKFILHRRCIEDKHARHHVQPARVTPLQGSMAPELATCTAALAADFPLLDALNEKFLFHGTTSENCNMIVKSGFDNRLGVRGMYGSGTYFASQSCKSHQYTCTAHSTGCSCKHPRWLIVARVILGDPHYTGKVCQDMKKPPARTSACGDYDTVIANPGPMIGHKQGYQSHQEFVIFDSAQAYPAFVVEYKLSDTACTHRWH